MHSLRRWTAAAAVAAVLAALPAGPPREAGETEAATTEESDEVERLRVEVLETYPHDPDAFTQGLELRDGLLYESTGRYGESDVRAADPATGEVEHRVPLPDDMFGEGLTFAGDTLWQITWREDTAFRRDAETLEETGRAEYTGEGWGLCHDEERGALIMSDGSDELSFRDPDTFDLLSTARITLEGEPFDMINELECVGGAVWANVWLTDEIVRIDPDGGRVEAVVDASGLLSQEESAQADVLNGIAAVPDSDTFLITGKLWPRTFLVRFVPQG